MTYRALAFSWEVATERFIHQQNLELYRKLLADSNDMDEGRRQIVLKLLAAEKAKHRQPPKSN